MSSAPAAPRALVAGVGNVLRGDDGFGPAVVRALSERAALPDGITILEVGIGGMGLVHELMAGYDLLVILDAVHGEGPPGTVYVIEPELPEGPESGGDGRASLSADMHEIVPERVLLLARALGVLPPVVRIVGCEPACTEDLSLDLSPEVKRAVPAAVEQVGFLLEEGGLRRLALREPPSPVKPDE